MRAIYEHAPGEEHPHRCRYEEDGRTFWETSGDEAFIRERVARYNDGNLLTMKESAAKIAEFKAQLSL